MKSKSLGEVVRALRKERGLTQEQLADAPGVGMDAGNLSRFERGQQSIHIDRLESLARFLGVPMSEIYRQVEGVQDPPAAYETAPVSRLPLISWVQAGAAQLVSDPFAPGDADTWVLMPGRFSPPSFALRIRGDSMVDPSGMGPSFPENCIIGVDPALEARHKSLVVARVEDSAEATFKQLIVDGSMRLLKPLNPRYPIVQITSETAICGVVREMLMNVSQVT